MNTCLSLPPKRETIYNNWGSGNNERETRKMEKIMGFYRQAWTGGDTPTKAQRSGRAFRDVRTAYFREQVAECGGLDLWACAGTSCLERARIFWNRATLDAHRTVNG